MSLRQAVVMGVAGLCAACRSHPATEVLVFFHADVALRAEAARIAVRVEGPEGGVFEEEHATSATSAGALARVPLVPRDGDASRAFRVEGRLLDGAGVELARVEAISGYEEDRLLELHLWFDSACRDKLDCGPGRTCSLGVCVGSCFHAAAGAGEEVRSVPSCGECEECLAGACAAVGDGSACGCAATDACAGGACVSPVQVWSASGGYQHTCAAVQFGQAQQIWCWGTNRVGQLGTGAGSSSTPALVPLGAAIVVAATDSTCARGNGGDRSCWGYNGNGALGTGVVEDVAVTTPAAAPADDPRWVDMDAGWYHLCGVSDDSRLFCWGLNDRGQAGRDPAVAGPAIPTPTEVLEGSRWTAASAGGFTSCGLRDDGTLWCFGLNTEGELGVGDGMDRSAPVQTGCPDGTCLDDWTDIANGDFHTCAVRANGELWCWGADTSGQLGTGEVTDENDNPRRPVRALLEGWTSVHAGQSHTCGLREDSTLWCFGANDRGQLGLGDSDQRSAPTQVPVPGGGQWLQVAPGRDHTCAVRSDRTLWCWGFNDSGQLGLGFETLDGDPLVTTPRQVCFPPP